MRLIAKPLTSEAFAEFGDVLSAPPTPGRIYAEAALSSRRAQAAPSLSFTFKTPNALPILSTTMERHQYSSQSFVPMGGGRWIAIVAPHAADGGPDMAKARAFVARADQGVTYGANVWHHPFTVIDQPGRFAVFMWKDGTTTDEEFVEVAPFEVDLDGDAA
ncbi:MULTISPECIES: ureidoglycolate lyase [Roseomonadaceae]|uniref:Ureidoglycolate lyase n=1 Tax=Falsiroseomonas oleicola TaxID=2801474 RepID=A0ABS6H3B2_9PROT|nr:ureidoglycolate lyase [Roseomonas oleicola]MBU8542503.1 ureidoglycolate lyase [Roseomonas oleicola]